MCSILKEVVGEPTKEYHTDVTAHKLKDDTQGGSHSERQALRLGQESWTPIESRKAHDIDKEVGQGQGPNQSVTEDLATDKYEDPEKFARSYKEPEKYNIGSYIVTADLLRVRRGPSTDYDYKKFSFLTPNAQSQIRKLTGGKSAHGLVKGCECTVSQIEENWGKIPSGWICLDYCRLKVKT